MYPEFDVQRFAITAVCSNVRAWLMDWKVFSNERHVANTWSNHKIQRHSQYRHISAIKIDISRYINSKYRTRKWRPPDLWAGTGARAGRSILHDATPTGRMGSVACNLYIREQWARFDVMNCRERGTCRTARLLYTGMYYVLQNRQQVTTNGFQDT
jgi:hypothetical protein